MIQSNLAAEVLERALKENVANNDVLDFSFTVLNQLHMIDNKESSM